MPTNQHDDDIKLVESRRYSQNKSKRFSVRNDNFVEKSMVTAKQPRLEALIGGKKNDRNRSFVSGLKLTPAVVKTAVTRGIPDNRSSM